MKLRLVSLILQMGVATMFVTGCQSTKNVHDNTNTQEKHQDEDVEMHCLHDGGGLGVDICVPKGEALPPACLWRIPAYGNYTCQCWDGSYPDAGGDCPEIPEDQCIRDLSGRGHGNCQNHPQ